MLRKPTLLLRHQEPGAKGNTGDTPPDTADALVQRLHHEIIEAAEFDTLYSPQSDVVRHVLGNDQS